MAYFWNLLGISEAFVEILWSFLRIFLKPSWNSFLEYFCNFTGSWNYSLTWIPGIILYLSWILELFVNFSKIIPRIIIYRINSWNSFLEFLKISWNCSETFLELFWNLLEPYSWNYSETFVELFWNLGIILKPVWNYSDLELFLELPSWNYSETFLDFWEFCGIFLK